jgi:hypothetical protein
MTLTPEQFNMLATKQDLNELTKELLTKDVFNEFKSEFKEMKNYIRKLITSVNELTKDMKEIKEKFVFEENITK